jgi:hypothetical protein
MGFAWAYNVATSYFYFSFMRSGELVSKVAVLDPMTTIIDKLLAVERTLSGKNLEIHRY